VDFTLDETQQAVQQVAAEVLRRERERIGHDETLVPGRAGADAGFDETAWKALAQAGMLSLALPERLGGEGLGLLEVSLVLSEVGRQVAPVPAAATFAAMLFAARNGSTQQQDRWLEGIATGAALLTCGDTFGRAWVRAERIAAGARLHGSVPGVAYAQSAGRIVLPAVDGDGPLVVVLDPSVSGVTLRPGHSSACRQEATVVLDGAVVPHDDVVDGAAAADDLRRLFSAASCAVADGVLAGALDLTTEHVRTREQFGRPLATFQGVAEQAADVYVASRTLHLATRRACWRLHHRLDADEELAVAAYWTTTHAPPAVQTCHHLHGGTGVDATYPLHQHYGWTKDLTRALGGSEGALEALGGRLRLTEPAEPDDDALPAPGGMVIALSREQRALRDEMRAYFEGLVSPEERQTMLTERHGQTYREVVRRMGRDGRLGVGWPVEYGGRGFGEVEQQVFVNEASRADVPLPYVTLQTVGPTLQSHGTEEQRDLFLPRILAGDVHFAIGYTEPDAGTDLAALRTTATRDGDAYVVNGQKIFTTGAHDADYIWLAVRTDPDAPRHKGISILIVDTTAEGYSWSPIITCDGAHHVNATYFDNVRVPASMLVGEENGGWRLITTQLNHERVMLGPAGRVAALLHRVAEWAAGREATDGSPLLDLPAVRRVLAEAQACLTVNETLNWQVAASAASGPVQVADASATKVFASECVQRVGRLLEEVVGCHGDPAEPETARLLHWLDVQARRNLVLTFGGGVNEIQRELIAQMGLGLPRVPR
jgi:alkylation response protein AidB-like acyl-CoA dehydrogenase